MMRLNNLTDLADILRGLNNDKPTDGMGFGNAWVYGNAMVSGYAEVFGNAWVSGYAVVSGDAKVYEGEITK